MNDYLDAECVFAALISGGFFTKKVWKNTLGDKTNYHVMFELAEFPKTIGFVVYIIGGYHRIGRTSLINKVRQLNIPLGDILTRCAVVP